MSAIVSPDHESATDNGEHDDDLELPRDVHHGAARRYLGHTYVEAGVGQYTSGVQSIVRGWDRQSNPVDPQAIPVRGSPSGVGLHRPNQAEDTERASSAAAPLRSRPHATAVDTSQPGKPGVVTFVVQSAAAAVNAAPMVVTPAGENNLVEFKIPGKEVAPAAGPTCPIERDPAIVHALKEHDWLEDLHWVGEASAASHLAAPSCSIKRDPKVIHALEEHDWLDGIHWVGEKAQEQELLELRNSRSKAVEIGRASCRERV